jgi:endonuclease YncB( thermonuclease family)
VLSEPTEPTGAPEPSPTASDSKDDKNGLELESELPGNPRNPEIVERIPGKVIVVINGDTVKFLNNYHQQFEVRLEGVDAPELDQQHGAKAKEALAGMVLGKEIVLGKTGVDRYGRVLGFVLLGPVDVGLQMLEDGWAWHFKKYNSNSKYRFAEERAKAAHLGLWKSDNVVPPWDYRDTQRRKLLRAGQNGGAGP